MRRNLFISLLTIITLAGKAQSNFTGSGISLNFGGATSDGISIGDVYNDLAFPVTFEAWINPTFYEEPYAALFCTDASTTGSYYGLWIYINPAGNLNFEIGDGAGSGLSHRKGKRTTTTLPLNTWTHIAVVATSVSDVKFYFNGMSQATTGTAGTGSVSSLIHSAFPGYIGLYSTIFDIANYSGQMDEVRLWNTARTETDVRTYMCRKLSGFESGLIGYWRADESYTSTTVEDASITGADGTISGAVTKLTSGAPLGNASVYTYATDWSGVTMQLNSSGGDKFKVNKIINTPSTVHIYRVNGAPYSEAGLTGTNVNYYFGVFTVNGASAAKYNVTYTYSLANGVTTEANESSSALYRKTDGSVITWANAGAIVAVDANRATKKNSVDRFEYIYTVDETLGKFAGELASDIIIYPNPASDFLYIQHLAGGEWMTITDLSGKILQQWVNGSETLGTVDLHSLPAGIYFLNIKKESTDQTFRFAVK